MGLKAATLYDVDWDSVTPMAVFRLAGGHIVVEQLFPCQAMVDDWLQGTWDPDEERMIMPLEGERYLRALVERPMTRARFESGEPDPSFRWHGVDKK
jgi:hypothetical protein